MRNTILILIVTLFFFQKGFAQQNKTGMELALKKMSYVDLTDSLIKTEIGLFNIFYKEKSKDKKPLELLLTEIPLKKCTEKTAFFTKREVIVSISKHEESKSGLPELLYIHNKFGLSLPDTAIADITEVVFCPKLITKGKLHNAFRVFRSKDNHRVYIHMVNDKAEGPYEVTWVIVDSKYRFKVVDPVTI